MNIKKNRTLFRKATYEPAFTSNKIIPVIDSSVQIIEHSKNAEKLSDSYGIYLRPENHTDYIDNHTYINRTIQISSADRDFIIFKNPFDFTTYVGYNQVLFKDRNVFNPNGSLNNNYGVGEDKFIRPRIGTIIPNVYKINLNSIIIPDHFNIVQDDVSNNDLYTEIGSFLLANLSALANNKTFLVPITTAPNIHNIFITITNFVPNTKINIITQYDTSTVYSYVYNNTSIQHIYKYHIDCSYSSRKDRSLHLNIYELNDDVHEYTTTVNQKISTFKLYPKVIKNKFLYAETKNIEKVFDKTPLKLNKFSIQLADTNNVPLQIFFLDYDVSTTNVCICSPINKDYSCSCNYILHPLNPMYQMYIFFNFLYKNMNIDNKLTGYFNNFVVKNKT
jgi:hypothetical protein